VHRKSIFFEDFKGYRRAVYQVHGKAMPFTSGTYSAIILSSGSDLRTPSFPDLIKNVPLMKNELSMYLGYNTSDSEYAYYHNSYLERQGLYEFGGSVNVRIARHIYEPFEPSNFVDKVRRFRELEVMQHLPG
jgi:hypothetical protein